jgi:hypothetical protein
MQLDKLAGCSQSEIKGSLWMSQIGVRRHFKMVKIADALSVALKKKWQEATAIYQQALPFQDCYTWSPNKEYELP